MEQWNTPDENAYARPPRVNFRVGMPRFLGCLFDWVVGVFAIPTVIGIATGQDPTGWLISLAVFALIWGLVELWVHTCYIQVNGWMITVSKTFGLVKFKVHISEIRQVYNVMANIYGRGSIMLDGAWKRRVLWRNSNVTVYTDRGTFKVETLMENSEKMLRYLEENLDPACFTVRDLT